MLSTLYAAIAVEMLAINAYVAPLIGERNVRTNAPTKIVFVPNDLDLEEAHGPGGNPRPIGSRWMSTECYIHGPTTDHCEGMFDQVIIALRAACKKPGIASRRAAEYRTSKGKWTRSTFVSRNGEELRFVFSVLMPIVERRWPALTEESPTPQPPIAATYAGAQANTFATVPAAEMTVEADIGFSDGDPDNVVLAIPQPPPPEDPPEDP